MKSINFEFLWPKWQEFTRFVGFAEVYVDPAAVGFVSKLSVFSNQAVELIYQSNIENRNNITHLRESILRIAFSGEL